MDICSGTVFECTIGPTLTFTGLGGIFLRDKTFNNCNFTPEQFEILQIQLEGGAALDYKYKLPVIPPPFIQNF